MNLYKQKINALRFLAIDAVEQANSGHPGIALGLADVVGTLFLKHLKINPAKPEWPSRDRFVMSGGHGSSLLYSALHLSGYKKITLKELKNFRQKGSVCAGHPEVNVSAGIECTTGPLGQGIAMAVGMAIAEEKSRSEYGKNLISNYTYVTLGDGDLQEGVSHEACSLAGHLKLSKLIMFYDDNSITIDGSTKLSFTENVKARFLAYGFDVQKINGHNTKEISRAIIKAQKSKKPSIIICKTKIGYGSPKAGTSSVHGSPLGSEALAKTRENLGWENAKFKVPAEIKQAWKDDIAKNKEAYVKWEEIYKKEDRDSVFNRVFVKGELSFSFEDMLMDYKNNEIKEKKSKATRKASGEVLEILSLALPEMMGGSADLSPSNNTFNSASKDIEPGKFSGNYIRYGVREFAMVAIENGISLYGGLIPYVGTFLCFSDYARGAIRLSALMGTRGINIFTHDSIGLGEDGPTHQPVEHVASLRAMPNLNVFRPADSIEAAECLELAVKSKNTPSIMALTRQGLPVLRKDAKENLSAKGAYILDDCKGKPDVVIMASGSELKIAVEAKNKLKGKKARVVSVPCMDIFDAQDLEYKESVIGKKGTKIIAVEAGVQQCWDKYLGDNGSFVGMSTFGESAPIDDLYEHFGITVKAVLEACKK
ncbi:MAG: transketolase [Alphaproteobacteria bacterium]|nr:transketolase [Alphaproteobacteria bacterium]